MSSEFRRTALVIVAALIVTGCGKLTVQQAESRCLLEARQVRNPFAGSEVAVGTGYKATIDLTISTDYLNGRDPNDVFASCVRRRSGQLPTRPVYDQPGWR
ncbi:MAG: hypothetical protein DI533_14260 [Cereibacter sphaeroides]|uniref:Lipoprotein n=1 Tax=Cereibacter sphaeroides TaxID=1063 RepID=A0A2W5TLZ6_CERSP|nr:MAG: hypothetical protein DI533_14260 [Cereibacter sphaeroides]